MPHDESAVVPPAPGALLSALSEVAPTISHQELRVLLHITAQGPLRLPTRELQRQTGLSTGSMARALHSLEQRQFVLLQRGARRSQALGYDVGPALAILAESCSTGGRPCSTVEQATLDLRPCSNPVEQETPAPNPCSTQTEHSSTVEKLNSGNMLHPDGARPPIPCSKPVIPCSTQMEQAPIPCSTQMEQAQTVMEQAQLAEAVAHAGEFATRLEQAPSIDRLIDGSIDRSMLQNYKANHAAAAAALDRVVSIGAGRRYAAEEVETARTWLMGYMAANPPKYGEVPQLPPDDNLVRQFLCIAAPEVLRECLLEMHRLKKSAGNAWAWFVTVVMQQIYGIRPEALRRKREEARAARQQPKPETNARPAPGMSQARDLLPGLMARAAGGGR